MPDDLSPPVYTNVSLILCRRTHINTHTSQQSDESTADDKKEVEFRAMTDTRLTCAVPVSLELVYGGERLSCDAMYWDPSA